MCPIMGRAIWILTLLWIPVTGDTVCPYARLEPIQKTYDEEGPFMRLASGEKDLGSVWNLKADRGGEPVTAELTPIRGRLTKAT